ncbi:MAG: Gfo/Idh/MocA family oxidoreductase [Gammaproteobacteria bacterium]|nr:Gfo/Idh/MocA family oxidoreductase [Gammaproteobacteria bacterium]
MTDFAVPGRLALGFIGGGLSSAVGQTHFAACHLDGRWSLEAGAFSRDREVNRRTAENWRVSPDRVYDSWRDLLLAERSRLDAVVVLTPTPNHYEIVQALLKAGIPIICEKALVASVNDARALLAIHDAKKNFVAVTFNYSGYPMVRELRTRIDAGEFGAIQQLHIEMPQEGFVRPPAIAGKAAPPQSWRLKDDFIPTICLDLGVHLHHLTTFLTGEEPQQVNAEFGNFSRYRGIVDNVAMWAEYPSGMTSNFWMSKTAVGRRNGLRIRLFGETGSAEWYQLESEQLHISTIDGSHLTIDRGGQATVAGEARYNRMKVGHPSGFIEAFANLYTDIADALLEWRSEGRHRHPYVYGMEHATDGLATLHAARLSSSRRRWERVHATPHHERLVSRLTL